MLSDDSPPQSQLKALDLKGFGDLAQQLTGPDKLPAIVATRTFNRYLNILPNPVHMCVCVLRLRMFVSVSVHIGVLMPALGSHP